MRVYQNRYIVLERKNIIKKGIIRMVCGAILVGLQLLSILGSIKARMPLPNISFADSSAQILYDLIFCASYYLVGIIGVALFIFGYIAYFSKTTNCNEPKKLVLNFSFLNKKNILVIIAVFIFGLCLYRINNDRKHIVQLSNQVVELQEVVALKETELNEAKSELETAEKDYLAIKEKYRVEYSENYVLNQEIKKMKPIYQLFDKELVLTDKTFKMYHKPDCILISKSVVINGALTPSVAKNRGYSKCGWCHK